MILKTLSRPQWQHLYRTAMVRDFPASELKSISMLEQLEDKGWYTVLGFYFEEEPQRLCAYALLVQTNPGAVLLDYFAVDPSLRGGGIGGKILDLLKQWASQKAPLFLAEVEDPDFAQSPEDLSVRNRRIGFYRRNGFALTGVCAQVLQDHYRIIAAGTSDGEAAYREMAKLYFDMAGEDFFRRHITVFSSASQKSMERDKN